MGLLDHVWSQEELQQRLDEDKVVKHDWKYLSKAKEYEKINIKKAISIYEGFVSQKARYPLPYQRLPIIYHKLQDYANERRVLEVAVEVFVRENDTRSLTQAKTRLAKLLT